MKFQITQVQLDILSRTIISAVERFYSNPENRTKYDRWIESEEGKAYTQRVSA